MPMGPAEGTVLHPGSEAFVGPGAPDCRWCQCHWGKQLGLSDGREQAYVLPLRPTRRTRVQAYLLPLRPTRRTRVLTYLLPLRPAPRTRVLTHLLSLRPADKMPLLVPSRMLGPANTELSCKGRALRGCYFRQQPRANNQNAARRPCPGRRRRRRSRPKLSRYRAKALDRAEHGVTMAGPPTLLRPT